ncbi:Outer membrane protein assembly factor BamB precursor [Phycisphaerae bacterium RAS1]|nr:Outer membrane protein assembly factor BamB precursor [Phycisphaerae bacterium RAS1]
MYPARRATAKYWQFSFGIVLTLAAGRLAAADGNWPQFRGEGALGIADGRALPTEFDVASGKNIVWKIAAPGLSHASPIVWGEHVFIWTAAPTAAGTEQSLKVGLYGAGDSAEDMVEHEWKLICLNKKSGKTVWEQVAYRGEPKFKRHTKATQANSTPATDGKCIVVLGPNGLTCYGMDGRQKWTRELGPLDVGPHNAKELHWGFAASPILADGRVVVQCDIKENAYIAAFDAADGRELWRTPRDDVPGWSTPAAATIDGSTQIIANGCKRMAGYDLSDGRDIWHMSGGGGIPVPTPVIDDGLIYLTSNHRPLRNADPTKPIFVLKTPLKGEIATPAASQPTSAETAPSQPPQAHVAWMKTGRGNYMQTPLVYRGLAYFCNDNGMLTAYDARTGEEAFRERLGGGSTGFTASMVAGDGKLFVTSEEGEVFILSAGRSLEILGNDLLDDVCLATPAISEGCLYFRTQHGVVAIAAR